MFIRSKKYTSNFMDGYLTILSSHCQSRVLPVSPVSSLSVPCPHCQSSVHPVSPVSTLSIPCPHCQSGVHPVNPLSSLPVQCPHCQSRVHDVSPVSTLSVQFPHSPVSTLSVLLSPCHLQSSLSTCSSSSVFTRTACLLMAAMI